VEEVSFRKLRRWCFCNSSELLNTIFLIGGVPHEWVGFGMVECSEDPGRRQVLVTE